MKVHLVGNECEISGYSHLRNFGDAVELPDELAAELVAKRPLLPAADFAEIGFTVDELRRHATPAQRMNTTGEFAAKVKAALRRLHEIRQGDE